MAKRAVMMLFPELTHCGKQYSVGEIELNPTPYLVEAAKERTKQYHRDSSRDVRICRFVRKHELYDPDNPDGDEEEIVRTPAVSMKSETYRVADELDGVRKQELVSLVSALGFKNSSAKKMEEVDLRKLVRFLRRV